MVDWAPAIHSDSNSSSGNSQRLRRRGPEPGAGARARGQYKSAQGLTYLAIYDAGHLAPMDAPAATLAMVRCVRLVRVYRVGFGVGLID